MKRKCDKKQLIIPVIIPEKVILKSILDYLTAKKVFHWRQNIGSFALTDAKGNNRYFRAGTKGMSDIIAIAPDGKGQIIAIEVKSTKGKISDDQELFLQKIQDNGGMAIVARQLEEVISMFRDMGWVK